MVKNELHNTTDPAKKELYSKLKEKHNLLQRYVAMINIIVYLWGWGTCKQLR